MGDKFGVRVNLSKSERKQMSKIFKQAVQVSLSLALLAFAAQSVEAGTRPPGRVRPPSTVTPVRPPNFGFIPTRPSGSSISAPSTSAPSTQRASVARTVAPNVRVVRPRPSGIR